MTFFNFLTMAYQVLASSCAGDEFLFQGALCKKCDEYISSCSRCETGNYSAIINGSFEQTPISSGVWEYYSSIPGWYPDGGEDLELKSDFTAYDGNQYLECMTDKNVKVNQDLTTETNYWYSFEFYYSPYPGIDSTTNRANIYWDNSIIDTLSRTGSGSSDNQWTLHTYTRQATSSSTQIAFEGASPTDNNQGAAIDLVSYHNLPSCTECSSYQYPSLATNTCLPCPSFNGNCSECEEVGGTPSCKVCVQGFYPSAGDCASCPSNCNDCDSNGDCVDCDPAYTIVSGVCVICNSPCTSCDTSGNCLSCLTGYYVNSNNCSSCSSNCNDCDSNGDCVDCDPAYKIISGVCVICDSPCTSCDTSGNCLTCLTGFYVEGNVCSSCPSNCNDCDSNGDCVDCESPFVIVSGICIICNSPCLSCDTNNNCLICGYGYYVNGKNCSVCPEKCLNCDSNGDCLECGETYEVKDGECKCPAYFLVDTQTSLCYYSPLEFDFEFDTNSYTIQFTEDLSAYLDLSNIESQFLPNGPTFKFIISILSLQKYELKIDSSLIPEDARGINVKLLNVSGKSGSTLLNNEFNTKLISSGGEETANLSEDSNAPPEEDEEMMGELSSEEVSKVSVASGVAGAVGASLLMNNPSSFWGFVNFSLMIYYMPLQNINMPVPLREFCKGFGTSLFGIALNFAKFFSLKSDSSSTKQLWRDYDIENTSFYENAGNVIFLFLIGLGLLPVLGVLYLIFKLIKLRIVSNFLEKMILQYRWNFFLRASIEFYIEILSSAILCGLTAFERSIDSEVALSISLCLVCALIPLLLTSLTNRFHFFLTSEGSELSKFSTFFEEFKRDKLVRLFYYPLFYFRRLFYIVGIYFLYNYPLVQVIINSCFSFLICAYICIFKPYRNGLDGFLSALSEFILGVVFVATGFCLADLSEEHIAVVRDIIICGILTFVAANIFISFIVVLKFLRNRCKRKRPFRPRCAKIIQVNEASPIDINNKGNVFEKSVLDESSITGNSDINSIY